MDKDFFLMRNYLIDKQSFKLEALAEVWKCSTRTARRKLEKYSIESKLIFVSGKGRGNLSQVLFTKQFEVEFKNEIERALSNRSYEDLIFLLHLDFQKEWIVPYLKEINSLFKIIETENYQTTFKGIFARSITSLDPTTVWSALEAFILSHIGNTLVTYDQEANEVTPNIAYHWDYLEDQKEWIFYIRKGVYFHSGKKLTAFDIEYSLNRVFQRKRDILLFKDIKQIKALNPYILSIRVHKNSHDNLLRLFSTVATTIIQKDTHPDSTNFIGTGPFKIDTVTDTKVTLKTFDFYFGFRPMIDKAEFWIIQNDDLTPLMTSAKKEITIDDGFSYLVFNSRSHNFSKKEYRESVSSIIKNDITGLLKKNYFDEPTESDIKFNKSNSKTIKHVNLAYIDSSDSRKEALHLKRILNNSNIAITLITISKHDYFNKKYVLDDIDILLSGELPGNDQELSFLNFVLDNNLPIRQFLPSEFFNFINQLNTNNAYTTITNITRAVEQQLLRMDYVVYLEKKRRKLTIFDEILFSDLKNTFGHIGLNNIWISETDQPSITDG